jgi:pimeloyl-ACP methyl ester carboxylesterase
MSTWSAVINRLPAKVATFAYDRPGYGGSGPSPKAERSPCDVARELNALLTAIGVKPPFILVGHSLGGQYHYAYARLFPEQVAGMVLLDPTHPDHWNSLQREAPAVAATVSTLRATLFSTTMRAEFDGQGACLDQAPPLASPIPTRILVRTKFELVETLAFRSVVARLMTDWVVRLPGATAVPVDGAGHYIHRDRAEVVVAEIKALHDSLPAAGR